MGVVGKQESSVSPWVAGENPFQNEGRKKSFARKHFSLAPIRSVGHDEVVKTFITTEIFEDPLRRVFSFGLRG
jgi:hypothetical protein